jgi:hypothetical protein
VPRHTPTLVALTAAVMALSAAEAGAASSAPDRSTRAPRPCKAPASGFQSCLRVLYTSGTDGSPEDVRVTATLLRRVDACPPRAGKRAVVISRDGERLGSARRPGSCRKGVITWRTAFSAGETAGWALQDGDTIDSAWRGVRNASTVTLGG